MDETTTVGARLALEDRAQFQKDSASAAESVESIGTATTKAADMADSSAKRFGMFGSKVKTAGIAATDAMGAVGANAGNAFGDGFTRDAQGRLRDAHGKFVSSGAALGRGITTGALEGTAALPAEMNARMGSRMSMLGGSLGSRLGGGMSKKFMGYAKVMVGSLAAFFAAEEVKKTLMGSVDEANMAVKAQRQTAAALKSTHDASGETAGGIDKMSKSLETFTGQSKLANQGALNMLLTFPAIQKGGKIFQDAAKQSANLAARLNMDPAAAAKMVGKALQNGATGITALGRAGIKFSADQTLRLTRLLTVGKLTANQAKEMAYLQGIQGSSTKKLTAAQAAQLRVLEAQSKSTMKGAQHTAQRTILNALQNRVGGAAKANITPIDMLRVKWADFEETLGKKLLPDLDRLEVWMTKKGIPDLEKFGGWLGRNKNIIKDVGIALLILVGAWKLYRGYVMLSAAATAFMAENQTALNLALDANPIGAIVLGIAALAAGLIIAYKKSQTFRDIVQGAFKVIGAAIDFVKDHWKLFVKGFLAAFVPFGIVLDVLIFHFHRVKSIATTVFHDVIGAAKDVGHGFMTYIANPIEDAYHFVKRWGGKILDFITSIPGLVKTAFVDLGKIILAPWQWAFHYIAIAWNDSAGKIGFHTPGWLGPLGHKGFSIPSISVPPLPALAAGGSVAAGTAYLVGERGPEMFMSGVSGVIIPNHALRGGDGAHTPNVTRRNAANNERTDETADNAWGDGEPLVFQSVLDGKVIAESVYKFTRGKVARQ